LKQKLNIRNENDKILGIDNSESPYTLKTGMSYLNSSGEKLEEIMILLACCFKADEVSHLILKIASKLDTVHF